MNAAQKYIFDPAGVATRIAEAMAPEKITAFAARIDVAQPTISKYLRGQVGSAQLDVMAKIAAGLGASLDWLVWGQGEGPNSDAIPIPRFDIQLAAGAAGFAEGGQQIGSMPFDRELLREIGYSSTTNLAVLQGAGDSMEPLIRDGSPVLIDLSDTRIREKIFAFRLGDELRIKKLRRLADGIQLISENPRYEPELLTGHQLDNFAVIGRAVLALTIL